MSQRGRKSKPTAIKLLEGNPIIFVYISLVCFSINTYFLGYLPL